MTTTDRGSVRPATQTLDSEARRILREAADYIAERGHLKGSLYQEADDPDGVRQLGPACIHGALYCSQWEQGYRHNAVSLSLPETVYERINELLRFRLTLLGIEAPDSTYPAATYNDQPTTTAEDAILLLKETAAMDYPEE